METNQQTCALYPMKTIQLNDQVTLHYKGTLANGELFDTSFGGQPLTFNVGQGEVIPGFEKAVVGMGVDESKQFTIPSLEAYGLVDESLIHRVSRTEFPEHINPEEGMRLVSNLEDGNQVPITITKVTADSITIDANHPLAGKDLTFDITIVSIN